ncbi:allantoinase PuuE [Pseudooceanicola sp. CBS1P-1]|uniref:Chitooligosaccharide deacetylase n=1 Tax=Pseudooceanicola albus TaxID=2692189 RepID=A0A6L7FXP8_9RHOB|nr:MULTISPECIES: allantoinase PuuE [Pseudooceanicola]MBT9383977.1 allantoinase PuuE [Pseudooceanicola endophyticus]MXN16611.1 allantoinase PuuE [Pseudooceanicola albus]
MNRYPRNMIGYGPTPPDARWPGNARIAISFVLNYEEGGENNILHGDAASEAFLSEVIGATPWEGKRHWNMESVYEYGARAGFWRLHRLFTSRNIPLTVYGVTDALARSPEQVWAMQDAGWEIASHGKKWVEHKDMPEAEERALMEEAITLHEELTGEKPQGWYTGRCSMNTVKLAAELGMKWVSDTIDDDLPYWGTFEGHRTLVIPYTMDTNDMRFAGPATFGGTDEFYEYLKAAFDVLYAEGEAGSPKMFSIGMHCRLLGRPGRMAGLQKFLDYIAQFEGVWCPRRIDIADHWAAEHPPVTPALIPSEMDKKTFVETFGGIFEHSPWIAKRAWKLELGPAHDSAVGVWTALARAFRRASPEERLGVLTAHPDLAGKLAAAKRLTAESTAEQASAGLDALTDAERTFFEGHNARYTEKFGFPFIIAVKENTKASIMEAMKTRLAHDRDTEFKAACQQVERIAYHRLKDLLP